MATKQIRLVYTGDHFYKESGSLMSPLYKENGERYDYGFLQRDLANGCEVTIRQCLPRELEYYTSKLNILKGQDKNA